MLNNDLIKNIDDDILVTLANTYNFSSLIIGVDINDANEKQLKKYRKWIKKNSSEAFKEYPENVQEILSDKTSDKDFFEFLRLCFEYLTQKNENEEKTFFNEFKEFDANIKKAVFYNLIDYEGLPYFYRNGKNMEFVIGGNSFFQRFLVFENVPQEIKYDENICYVGKVILRTETGYRFVILYSNYGEVDEVTQVTDESEIIYIDFDNISIREVAYNGINSICYFENPWQILSNFSYEFVQKEELSNLDFNDKEKEILPLIKEISAFQTTNEQELTVFPVIRNLLKKYNYNKLLKLLDKIEQLNPNKLKSAFATQNFILEFSKKQYEPMWREIFNNFCESQKDYPNKIEALHLLCKLNKARQRVQQIMKNQGYSGEYPNFIKEAPLRHINFVNSYGQIYAVGFEKRVIYRVRFFELGANDEALHYNILCTKELPRKKEKIHDIFSCVFNAKGKRYFNNEFASVSLIEDEKITSINDFEKEIIIYIKTNELKRLTKDEKKLNKLNEPRPWGLFWIWLVFGGGAFSILFNLFMMIFGIVALVVFGEATSIPAMFMEFPWIKMIAFAWIGFGGFMGMFSVFSKK